MHHSEDLNKDLQEYCLIGDIQKIVRSIDKGADRFCVDEEGRTCLHTACIAGNVVVVRFLLNFTYRVDEDAKDKFGLTPFHYACKLGYKEICIILVSYGCLIDCIGSEGTALLLACRNGYVDIARLLIKRGADVNYCDQFGKSILSNCRIKGCLDILSLLLDSGVLVDDG